jgi:hypothetical protein
LLVVWPKRVPEPAASTTRAALIPDFMGVIVSCLCAWRGGGKS